MNTKKRFYFLAGLSVMALGSILTLSGCPNQADQSTIDAAPPPKADAVKPPSVPNKKGQGSMSAGPASTQGGAGAANK